MPTTYQHNTAATKKPPVTVFIATAIFIFFCTLSAADSVGFVPDYIDGTVPVTAQADTTDVSATPAVATTAATSTGTNNVSSIASGVSQSSSNGVLPARIIIPAANINLPIQNPSTRDVDTLDSLLSNGPARYVDSAELGENGNLLIFAHSSHLPIVHNKNFQAFNNVPSLTQGDTITIVGTDGKDYLYSVDSVVKADVNDGTTIDLSTNQGKKLTLVTCDTLTGTSARFVLTATYVGVTDAN